METARNKHIMVFKVRGSPNKDQLKYVKTIAPIENPINLEGHICPPNAITIFFTENMNNMEIGIPIKTTNQ